MVHHVVMKRADGKEFRVGFYLEKRNADRFVDRINSDPTGSTARIVSNERLLRDGDPELALAGSS